MVNDRRKQIPFKYSELGRTEDNLRKLDKLIKSTTINDMSDVELKDLLVQINQFRETYYKYMKLDKKIKDSIIDNDILKSIVDLSKAIGQINSMEEPIKKELLSRSINKKNKNREMGLDSAYFSGSTAFFLKLWQDLDKYAEYGFGIAGGAYNIYTNGQYDMIAKVFQKILPFVPLGNRDLTFNTILREKEYVDDMINEFKNIRDNRDRLKQQFKTLENERDAILDEMTLLKPEKGQGATKEYRDLGKKFKKLTGFTYRQYIKFKEGSAGAFGNKEGYNEDSTMNLLNKELQSEEDMLDSMRLRFRAGMVAPNSRSSIQQFQGGRTQLLARITEIESDLSRPIGRGRLLIRETLKQELKELREDLARRGARAQNAIVESIEGGGGGGAGQFYTPDLFRVGLPGEDINAGEFPQQFLLENIANDNFNPGQLINQISFSYNKASLFHSGYFAGSYGYKIGKITVKSVSNMIGKVPLIFFKYPVIPKIVLPDYIPPSVKVPLVEDSEAPGLENSDYKAPSVNIPYVKDFDNDGLEKPDTKAPTIERPTMTRLRENKNGIIGVYDRLRIDRPTMKDPEAPGLENSDYKAPSVNIPYVKDFDNDGLQNSDYKAPSVNIPYVKDFDNDGLENSDYKAPSVNIPYVKDFDNDGLQNSDYKAPSVNIPLVKDSEAPGLENSDYKAPSVNIPYVKDSDNDGLVKPKKWQVLNPKLDFQPKTVYMTKKLEQQAPNFIKQKEGFKQIKNGLMTDYEWYMTEDQIDRLKDKDILIKKKVERIRRKEREVIVNRQVGKPCGEIKCKKYKDFVKVNGMFG